ncbi:succinate dehydrogenase cytochrome b560 subunit, mitochondrial isoform 3-T3 [Sarcoramphus papa]
MKQREMLMCRSAMPAGSAWPQPFCATCCPDGNDGQGGDGPLLGEEHQVQSSLVPSYHHLQVVPAHGDVHHAPGHRRCAELRSLPLQSGCPAAPRTVSPLPGHGEVAQPGARSHLLC